MSALLEPFGLDFMQRALVAGVLAAITTALVGTWVVLRGLTFLGDALAHGVLPGIAVAFLAGVDLRLGAAAGAILMIGGLDVVRRRSALAEDVGIGLLFVGLLALGVVIISRAGTFAVELNAVLFGNVLGVGGTDIVVLAGTATAVGVTVAALHRPFVALAFDEAKAALLGLHPRVAHVVMLVLVALAVVASFEAVGTLLVFGLLVGPPATASLLVRRVPTMMLTATGLGVLAVVVGLLVSFHLDTAAGATIAGVAVALFFVIAPVKTLADRLRGRPA